MAIWVAVAAALAYSIALFALAHAGDTAKDTKSGWDPRWTYALSLGVYCTSWTFFGAVGTAVEGGWQYLPIYLGPVLIFTLGRPLVQRIIQIGKAQHSTSIADFLSARYGKSNVVAMGVTVTAVAGSLPYMTLQLKSVGQTLIALDTAGQADKYGNEIVLAITVGMAFFSVLFGTRSVDLTQHNRGMVMTIAAEAVVKLAVLLAITVFALTMVLGADLNPALPHASLPFSASQFDLRFFVVMIVGAMAVLCLPRQFHMTVVEAQQARMTGPMKWVFPAYLTLTALTVIPIVAAGKTLFGDIADPDMLMLDLPLGTGNYWLAILVFIGGFSAATGMIVVSTIALSAMITNDLVIPLVMRRRMRELQDTGRLPPTLILTRRITIVCLLAMAYGFYRNVDNDASLESLGLLAFASAFQFAPGLILGLIWPRAHRYGMIAGLVAGFGGWLLLLFLPAISGSAPPLQIHDDIIVSGILLATALNIVLFVGVSLISQATLLDRTQAARFIDIHDSARQLANLATKVRVADFRLLLEQLIGKERARHSLNSLRLRAGKAYADADAVDGPLIELAERQISGILGSSSALALIQSTLEGDPLSIESVMAMFDETSQRLQFGADLLQTAIENIDQGVSVVDRDLRLVAWNSRYVEMFSYPSDLVGRGRRVEDLIRFNLTVMGTPEGEIEEEVEKRLTHLRLGRQHRTERTLGDGRILRIVGNPTPNGGYVTSYSDVTRERLTEQALEAQVQLRTQQLTDANAALEAATRSKTRFLAAASHDLVQPMNAARLFASALRDNLADDNVTDDDAAREKNPRITQQEQLELLGKLDLSIETANKLLRALLDISRLDGGQFKPDIGDLELGSLFDELRNEFQIAAQHKGLYLTVVPTTAWVKSDRGLLMSVLQNLVTNAIRYSDSGKVLIGARRCGDKIRIQVMDQGSGIAPEDQARIFNEFTRLRANNSDGGLGLGLAIVQRSCNLLGVALQLTSAPGRGTCFAIDLPAATPMSRPVVRAISPESPRRGLTGKRVLCVDNDPAALSGLDALFSRWGMKVHCSDGQDIDALGGEAPDLLILDYQLDNDITGDAIHSALRQRWPEMPPAILMTAQEDDVTKQAAASMEAKRLIKPAAPASLRALVNQLVG